MFTQIFDGATYGSRIVGVTTPAYGYGEQGSGESIPPNSTLWFVIDVVSVK